MNPNANYLPLPGSAPASTATPAPTNPNATFQTQGFAAPTSSTPAKPVSVLSSSQGQQTVNNNTQTLQKIESAYAGPSVVDYLNSAGKPSDFNSRSQLAGQAGIKDYTGTADQNTQLLSLLRNPTGSPATQSMVDELNRAAGQGGLSTSELEGLKSLMTTQDGLVSAAGAARSALDGKDYASMDFYTTRATELQKAFQDQLSKYYAESAPLRQRQLELLSPTAREQAVTKSLNDIRNQIQQFNIQTEEDKFREFEGQTLGFAGGRASEIDIRGEFKRQRMQQQEANLLSELGLEQELRKAASETVDAQLGYLSQDFELQSKVQDRITEQEDLLFERADTLRAESKETLVSILEMMAGVNPSEIPPQTKSQLETLAARSGLPFDLVLQALKTQHQRQVFEDSIATEKATPNGVQGPTSYQEWVLAGSPGTYADYLKDSNVKAPTVAQQTVATYATRIEQANPTITSSEQYISSMNPAVFEAQRRLPSYFQTPEFQKFDQAARNYINAVLRRESGAVISPSEFDNAYRQYLPRAGDTADTLAQKKANRQINYESFKNAAGSAYQSVDDLLGTQGGTSGTTKSGLKYEILSD